MRRTVQRLFLEGKYEINVPAVLSSGLIKGGKDKLLTFRYIFA